MTATYSERSRAKRIRAKVRAGNAKPEDRRWLAKYEAARRKSPGDAPPDVLEADRAYDEVVEARAAEAAQRVEVTFPAAEPEIDAAPIAEPEPATAEPIAAESGPSEMVHVAKPGAKPQTCGDPRCPACSNVVGGHVCAATGKTVWDQIDEDAARGLAMMLFAGITLVIKMFRKDKQWVPPTDKEIDQLGKAIQKMTYRRINAIGAIDDIIMLGSALGMYVRRATMAPALKAENDA